MRRKSVEESGPRRRRAGRSRTGTRVVGKPRPRVRVVNRQRLIRPRRRSLEDLLTAVVSEEGVPAGFTLDVTIIRDRTIRPVNRDYLGRDRPTDVLAFPYIKPEEWKRSSTRGRGRLPVAGSGLRPPGMNLLGDVLVSSDQALLQARSRRVDAHDALAHLALHGTLHLLGYDHKRDRDARLMRRLERRYLGVWKRSRERRS